jgi:hypothetical protein
MTNHISLPGNSQTMTNETRRSSEGHWENKKFGHDHEKKKKMNSTVSEWKSGNSPTGRENTVFGRIAVSAAGRKVTYTVFWIVVSPLLGWWWYPHPWNQFTLQDPCIIGPFSKVQLFNDGPLIVQKPVAKSGIEIYGLNMSSNGRQCINHFCCGNSIYQGSLLKLHSTHVVICNEVEYAIKAVSLDEESYGCTVGFIPCFLLNDSEHLDNQILQVCLLYDSDLNKSRREYSKQNGGIGFCRFIRW